MLKKCCILLVFFAIFGVAQAQETHNYHGQLDSTHEEQEYKFLLRTGDAALITTTAASNDDLDTVLTLYDPSGEVVATNDDAYLGTRDSRIAVIARQDGIYRANVARYDNSTNGRYDLDITVGDQSILEYEVTLSGTVMTQDTLHFRFHYTLSGADRVDSAFLDDEMQAFEDSWRTEVDKMGWPAPPSDDVMGGDALYDVYILNSIGTGEDALGYTSPEVYVNDNPNTPEQEQYAATSYIVIDNDFHDVEFDVGQDEVSVMRATAFHEFHHAIQFGYDGAESHSWLAEATSVWMETVAAGKDQDGTGYISTTFQYPELCLGTTAQDGIIMYGEWTFMQFLTDEFGKDTVMDLWRQLADYEGFDALEHLLEAHGTNVPREVARYRLNNLARNYKLAPLFKATVWLDNTITRTGEWTHDTTDDGVQELGASYYEFRAPPGVYDVELRNDDHKLELWAVGVQNNGLDAIALGRGGGIDSSKYQQMYLMVFNPTYDNDVEDCTSVDYKLEVMSGKGTTNPVDSVWSRTYFEPLK